MTGRTRCAWAGVEPETAYHDTEWCVPSRDDAHLFELLTLEGAQAGLSWSTILKKREGYRAAFVGFDAERVARFTETDVDRLVADASIVRHRGKIESTIHNAHAVLKLREDRGTLAEYLWGWVDDTPIQNRFTAVEQVPAKTELSTRLSKDLQKRGFRFVGPTTVYAFMQAVGMVNDHTVDCFRHEACARLA